MLRSNFFFAGSICYPTCFLALDMDLHDPVVLPNGTTAESLKHWILPTKVQVRARASSYIRFFVPMHSICVWFSFFLHTWTWTCTFTCLLNDILIFKIVLNNRNCSKFKCTHYKQDKSPPRDMLPTLQSHK